MTCTRLIRLAISVVVCVSLFALPAAAEVKLPPILSDHMVLQADMPVPVWGTAKPSEKVAVKFAGQTKTAVAGKDGKWSVRLDALKTNAKPQTLTVSGGNTVTIKDVLVGEAWLCSGQSNMAWPVSRARNFKAEQAAAKYPQIRHYRVGRNGAGKWTICSPQTVAGFSATAYFFGRELHKELKVPVGLINSSVGGTPIEAWTGGPVKAPVETPKAPANKPAPKKGKERRGRASGSLYRSMILPLAPYAIRGATWYQGESNAGRGHLYFGQLKGLIAGWRGLWKQGDFQFLVVQLPNFRKPQTKPSEPSGWVLVQEGELKALELPNTGLAVTIDVGEAGNIHPGNKQAVGKRLGLWALGTTYKKDIVYSGPLCKSMKIEGDKIVLTFDHVGGGLVARGGKELKGFAIAGADKKFVWGTARIVGKTVEVTGVKAPKAVRYAWAMNPQWSLTNKESLPASPFRTDDWK